MGREAGARERVTATTGAHADVVRVDFGGCLVRLEDGTITRARARGRLMGHRKALGNTVVVGDRAMVEPGERAGADQKDVLIAEVAPRRNAFHRRAAGRASAGQVVASNLDQVVHVAACADPPFSPGLADRVLCQAEHDGIPARVVLNKVDLRLAERESASILADYARAGYAGHAVSGKTGQGVAELLAACRGRRSLFVGHSGVGKSTLLNAMVPGLDLQEGLVNPKTGKGRHTTTAAWLLKPESDIELVDTPGVRVFGLWGIGPADLDHAYPEFRPALGRCRFADCAHASEPGCAVREAVARGGIAERRYASFLKLRAELAAEGARETRSDGPGA